MSEHASRDGEADAGADDAAGRQQRGEAQSPLERSRPPILTRPIHAAHPQSPSHHPASPTATASTPGRRARRHESMDVLRGVAVLGILAITSCRSQVDGGIHEPHRLAGRVRRGNRAAWWLTYLLFDMKMMSLFGILFGAGVVAFSARPGRGRR